MEQAEMSLMGEIPQVEPAPIQTVMSWRSEGDAVMWCVNRLFRHRPGLSREDVAEFIGVAKGTFTKICQGQLGLSGKPRELFQSMCGTIALEQYQLMQFGFVAVDTRKQAENQRELVSLKVENQQFKKLYAV